MFILVYLCYLCHDTFADESTMCTVHHIENHISPCLVSAMELLLNYYTFPSFIFSEINITLFYIKYLIYSFAIQTDLTFNSCKKMHFIHKLQDHTLAC